MTDLLPVPVWLGALAAQAVPQWAAPPLAVAAQQYLAAHYDFVDGNRSASTPQSQAAGDTSHFFAAE